MTPEELDAIRERTTDVPRWTTRTEGTDSSHAVSDRRVLLAEVDRLREELSQTKRTLAGYREQVRCLEAGADEW